MDTINAQYILLGGSTTKTQSKVFKYTFNNTTTSTFTQICRYYPILTLASISPSIKHMSWI